MEITEVRVFPVAEEKLKAHVTITFDGCFVIRGVKVIQGKENLFVAMPSKKNKEGIYKDLAHPVTSEFRAILEERVLGTYRRQVLAAEQTAPRTVAEQASAL